MKKQVIMYTLICDNCGKDMCEDQEYSAWSEGSPLEEMAENSGWLCEDDKHYCEDCYSYDDEDEIYIKKKI